MAASIRWLTVVFHRRRQRQPGAHAEHSTGRRRPRHPPRHRWRASRAGCDARSPPIAASMPSWGNRRWAITVKLAEATSATSTQQRPWSRAASGCRPGRPPASLARLPTRIGPTFWPKSGSHPRRRDASIVTAVRSGQCGGGQEHELVVEVHSGSRPSRPPHGRRRRARSRRRSRPTAVRRHRRSRPPRRRRSVPGRRCTSSSGPLNGPSTSWTRSSTLRVEPGTGTVSVPDHVDRAERLATERQPVGQLLTDLPVPRRSHDRRHRTRPAPRPAPRCTPPT